jgi:hypothetical protein
MVEIRKASFLLLTSVSLVAMFLILSTQLVRAQEQEAVTTEAAVPVSAETAPAEPEAKEAYRFVAQSGDSYTKMARKATQIYGIEKQVELSGAQIVFVETNLAQAAGSPELTLGEEVSIDKDMVGVWVDKAKNLSDEEKARWQKYADNVNFDTNNVGEAR